VAKSTTPVSALSSERLNSERRDNNEDRFRSESHEQSLLQAASLADGGRHELPSLSRARQTTDQGLDTHLTSRVTVAMVGVGSEYMSLSLTQKVAEENCRSINIGFLCQCLLIIPQTIHESVERCRS